jgi:glycosyltransferase 2 family protein
MNSKNFIIIFGLLLSAVLLIYVFSRLDWVAFFTAIKTISLPEVLLAVLIVMTNIALRSLRWNLVAGMPLTNFKQFWQAVNIGYLGNMIYPIRAGEVLKVVAIHHFTPLGLSRAVTTAVIDRMFDMIVVGSFTMAVLWIHGHRIDPTLGNGVITLFFFAIVALFFLMLVAKHLHALVQGWTTQSQWLKRLQEGLLHALESIQALRHTGNLVIVLLVTTLVFLLDYFWMWQIMGAFGWDLPFEAGLTVGVFLLLSISLPSAPGYIGVYQVAGVLALGLYGIDETLAVAYSIVVQLITFTVAGIQGMLITAYCGFNISQERQVDLSKVQRTKA